MPKMKTNRSASKRFKVTPKGKVMYVHSGKRHNLENMSPKRKRHASSLDEMSDVNTKHILRMLGKR
jgi:large subunit ribosomal protein L35